MVEIFFEPAYPYYLAEFRPQVIKRLDLITRSLYHFVCDKNHLIEPSVSS